MYIKFKTTRLKRCYLERRDREKAWGRAVARKYVQAIDALKAVHHPSHLGTVLQLDYEPLTQDRKGEHSVELGRRAHLIFTVHEGGDALIARIEEVNTTHYGH